MWYNCEKEFIEGCVFMKYHVIDMNEWVYPDRVDYETSSDFFYQFCAKNGKACGQILVFDAAESVSVRVEGMDAEIYEEIDVPVEENIRFDRRNRNKFFPSRLAPFRVYDALRPCTGVAKTKNGVCVFYVCVNAETLEGAGKHYGKLVLESGGEEKEVSMTVKVYDFSLPEESLKVVMGCYFDTAAPFHNVIRGSEEYERLRVEYLKTLRRMRQNMIYVDGAKIAKNGDGTYSFDFSDLEKRTKEALELGFKYFALTGIGFRRSWKASAIKLCLTDDDALSEEGKNFLACYIPALKNFLCGKGWLDIFCLGVADEPNRENADEYKALCDYIRSLAPELKLYDALSYSGRLDGALDIWIPLNRDYLEHKSLFDSYRAAGSEIWQYVCCGPRGDGFMNRFTDYPLICNRYQFWGNYKYDLKGYLHWAAVCYQPGQNPWLQSCPHHVNADSETVLPAGDTHLIYPGEGIPYMSMRSELHRAGIEDYEVLKSISEKNRDIADNLCNECFKAFDKVEFDMNKFRETLVKIYSAAETVNIK